VSALERKIQGVLLSCRSAVAIPKKFRPPVNPAVVASAQQVVRELRAQRQGDKTLAALDVQRSAGSWWNLLYAMETVVCCLSRAAVGNPNQMCAADPYTGASFQVSIGNDQSDRYSESERTCRLRASVSSTIPRSTTNSLIRSTT